MLKEKIFLQYNKVEICGVDTSKLVVLKEKEKITLITELRKGNESARDKLIEGNLRLVLSVVQRFKNRGEAPDDLFQIGTIGLIKAIDNFDVSQNVRFSTYAVPMIIGEIRRFLRDNSPIRVSRSIKDLAYRTMKAKEDFINTEKREPTVTELSDRMHEDRTNIVMALESIVSPMSIYEPVYSDSEDSLYVLDQLGDRNEEQNWLDEIFLKEVIKSLSDREQKIVKLRFLEGKTQMEVSREVGISQAQVSRLEKGVIKRIRS